MSKTHQGRRPFKKVSDDHKWLVGICGGIAYAFGIPVLFIRIGCILIFLLGTNPYVDFLGSIVFWMYILFWIFAPRWDKDPLDYEERTA